MDDKQLIVIDNQQYVWRGHYGAIFVSRERGRTEGDVRFIKGHLFRVYIVTKHSFLGKAEVSWIPIQEFDIEWIRAFKQHVFEAKG